MIRGRGSIVKQSELKIIYFRIINRFVRKGKKDFIFNIFLNSFFIIKRLKKKAFRKLVDRFFFVLRPLLQLRPLFSSGIIYQLPSIIDGPKEFTMAVFWFYQAVKMRSDLTLDKRFLQELRELFQNKGYALDYKKDYYKLIVQNRILLYRFKKKHRI